MLTRRADYQPRLDRLPNYHVWDTPKEQAARRKSSAINLIKKAKAHHISAAERAFLEGKV